MDYEFTSVHQKRKRVYFFLNIQTSYVQSNIFQTYFKKNKTQIISYIYTEITQKYRLFIIYRYVYYIRSI